MSEIKSVSYANSAAQGATGNVNVNVCDHTVSGNEVATDNILMAKMGDKNTYVGLVLTNSATRTGTVDIGYISLDDDVADNLTYFGAGKTLTAAAQELIVQAKELAFRHKLVVTVKTVGDLAADDVIELVATTVVSAG